MKISLSKLPSQHATKLVDFPRLDGGLNLWELDYRLDRNQSPEMKNLWWQDGVLQCRDGQELLCEPPADSGEGYTCFGDLYWDHAFLHIGPKLFYLDPEVIQTATYYASAYLVLQEDEFAYATLYNDYESRLGRISPGITAEVQPVEDSYGTWGYWA